MEEFVFRAIERLGYPIAVSVISFYACFKLFQMREKEREARNDRLVVATDKNTEAVSGLSAIIEKNMGSDPDGRICQARQIAAAMAEEKIVLKANEAAILLKRREQEAKEELDKHTESLKAELSPQL